MTTVNQLGDRLFGRRLRLRVALWVRHRPDRFFYLGEAAEGVKYTPSGVRDELARLVQLRMIKRVPRQPATRRAYYERLDSPLWAIIDSASEVVGKPGREREPAKASPSSRRLGIIQQRSRVRA